MNSTQIFNCREPVNTVKGVCGQVDLIFTFCPAPAVEEMFAAELADQ